MKELHDFSHAFLYRNSFVLHVFVLTIPQDCHATVSIDQSFDVLFMIIIGGLGSILGSLIGAAFIVLLPVLFKNVFVGVLGIPTDIAEFSQIILVGALIVFFLIKEPHGIVAYWRTLKGKLRLWPFPY